MFDASSFSFLYCSWDASVSFFFKNISLWVLNMCCPLRVFIIVKVIKGSLGLLNSCCWYHTLALHHLVPPAFLQDTVSWVVACVSYGRWSLSRGSLSFWNCQKRHGCPLGGQEEVSDCICPPYIENACHEGIEYLFCWGNCLPGYFLGQSVFFYCCIMRNLPAWYLRWISHGCRSLQQAAMWACVKWRVRDNVNLLSYLTTIYYSNNNCYIVIYCFIFSIVP